jgi:hypothetical protein
VGTIKTTNIEPIADNGTVTLGSSGDTFTLGSGVLQSNLMYPAFEAYTNVDQTAGDGVDTKITFNTEVLDTNSAYDTSTSRFTPQVAGKYLVNTSILGTDGPTTLVWTETYIYKNGSKYKEARYNFNANYIAGFNSILSGIVDMNGTTDYLEIYANMNSSDGGNITISRGRDVDTKDTYFSAYRIGS